MVTLHKGLRSVGVAMIIFGSAFAFLFLTGFLYVLSPNSLALFTGWFWGLGGLVFVFTLPVYMIGLCMVAAASRDVGAKAGKATLFALPLAVAGFISIFLSIPFFTRFIYTGDVGMGVGTGITMPLGWMFLASANYCSVGYLRDQKHLKRARSILITEIWLGVFIGVFLSLMAGIVLDEIGAFGSVFLILYVGSPIPLIVIGAVQFISCSRLYFVRPSSGGVRVIPSRSADHRETPEMPLLPFIQYDFSDTLTPEMFAKGFCFSCQAFVSTEIVTCPKCGKEIERDDIVRII